MRHSWTEIGIIVGFNRDSYFFPYLSFTFFVLEYVSYEPLEDPQTLYLYFSPQITHTLFTTPLVL